MKNPAVLVTKDQFNEIRRRNEVAITRAIRDVGQNQIAHLIDTSDATISRILKEDFGRFIEVISAVGQVLQHYSAQSVDADRLRAIRMLARDSLDRDISDSQFGSL